MKNKKYILQNTGKLIISLTMAIFCVVFIMFCVIFADEDKTAFLGCLIFGGCLLTIVFILNSGYYGFAIDEQGIYLAKLFSSKSIPFSSLKSVFVVNQTIRTKWGFRTVYDLKIRITNEGIKFEKKDVYDICFCTCKVEDENLLQEIVKSSYNLKINLKPNVVFCVKFDEKILKQVTEAKIAIYCSQKAKDDLNLEP